VRANVPEVRLTSLRGSTLAMFVAVAAWGVGCATAPGPLVDPYFASGQYTPNRITVLPPDVFVVLDQVGDNDPAQSAALGQAVSAETVRAVEQTLRARGYDVDLSARWDGIVGRDGSVLVGRDELGWLANGVLQFGNSPAAHGAMTGPMYVAPELAAKVGWATQSDALLYVNVKGVTTTSGKRAASILAGVFIVVIVVAIVLLLVASSKGGGSGPGWNGGGHGQPVARAPAGGWRGAPVGGHAPVTGGGWRGAPAAGAPVAGGWRGAAPAGGVAPGGGGWRGGGAPGRPIGAPVYGGGPNVGVAVVVPLDGPVYTHDGNVEHEDETFAGDELYVSMTLVSTYDGRVLWHARQSLDLDAEDNRDVDQMVQSFIGELPPRGGFPSAPPAPTKK
jgi:hypothetical protein